eukprot:bmy_09311T0
MDEILFEKFQFQTVLRLNSGALDFSDITSELCCMPFPWMPVPLQIFFILTKGKRKKLISCSNIQKVEIPETVIYSIQNITEKNKTDTGVVIREDYEENGHSICEGKLDI